MSSRYITGNPSGDTTLAFNLSMICNPEMYLKSIYESLEQLPSNFAVDPVVPTGKFWIIGPAANGLCFAYRKNEPYGFGDVIVHCHSDLAKAGFTPIQVVAQVRR